MNRNNRITKLTAILLSVFIVAVITYSTAISSIYAVHEHEHHETEHCIICLELHIAEHLIRQLMTFDGHALIHAVRMIAVSVLCGSLIYHAPKRNLITDKVRMDR